jgi:hypothetical protein
MKNLIMLVCMQIDTHWWQNNVFEKKKKISNLVPEFNHFLEWVVMILVIICLLSTHGTFSKIDHILYILYYICQASLDKYKNIEITCCILSDHNAKKLEFNNKRNIRKYTWRLKNTLIHDLWVIKKIREEIKKILEFNENEGSPQSKVYSHKCMFQKHRKISNKWPNLTSQNPRKTRTT